MSGKTSWSDAEAVEALLNPEPLPDGLLDFLRLQINSFDCEGWDEKIGHALIDRLRRHEAPAP